jgi:hypothetical protein
MFGDVSTHNTSVLPQTESYVHRFGPGMVLYWFGHAPLDRLNDAKGDLVIQGWDMPDEFMWPTGEIGRRHPTEGSSDKGHDEHTNAVNGSSPPKNNTQRGVPATPTRLQF